MHAPRCFVACAGVRCGTQCGEERVGAPQVIFEMISDSTSHTNWQWTDEQRHTFLVAPTAAPGFLEPLAISRATSSVASIKVQPVR